MKEEKKQGCIQFIFLCAIFIVATGGFFAIIGGIDGGAHPNNPANAVAPISRNGPGTPNLEGFQIVDEYWEPEWSQWEFPNSTKQVITGYNGDLHYFQLGKHLKLHCPNGINFLPDGYHDECKP